MSKADCTPMQRLSYGYDEFIAYHHTPAGVEGQGKPGVMFLGGFKSDMTGSKALFLEEWCRARGIGFTRFDYFGHGASSGEFMQGTIGRWKENTLLVLDRVAQGPQILVGSSMGGWIMLLAALERKERVAGLVGIAAAPDFTETLLWERYDEAAQREVMEKGVRYEPSCYGEEPYPITRQLIEEARRHLMLRGMIGVECPVRLLQGMQDEDVPWEMAVTLAQKLKTTDVEISLVKDGGHRMSEAWQLALLGQVVERLCATVTVK